MKKYEFTEKESNLSHEGNCFVFSYTQVYDDATVFSYAQVYNNAVICGNAQVYDDATVFSYAQVFGYSELKENMEASKKTKNIIGLRHNITISDNHIKIGCRIKTKKEWLEVTKEQAINMGLPEDEYEQYRLLIQALQ